MTDIACGQCGEKSAPAARQPNTVAPRAEKLVPGRRAIPHQGAKEPFHVDAGVSLYKRKAPLWGLSVTTVRKNASGDPRHPLSTWDSPLHTHTPGAGLYIPDTPRSPRGA